MKQSWMTACFGGKCPAFGNDTGLFDKRNLNPMNTRNRGQYLTEASDGLPALSVAEHAKDKEYALKEITGIFTRAMGKKWPGRLYYVDPFSGPGRCVIKDSGEETVGSPLIAVRVPFNHYYFGDLNQSSIDSLRVRTNQIEDMASSEKTVCYFSGEATETLDEVLKELPPAGKSLGLAVLDPWAWDFSFDYLKRLTRNRRLDILINFNIGDMKRRWWEPSPRLDAFLNIPTDHREFFEMKGRGVPDARTLLDHYERELGKIGYDYTADDMPVRNSNNTPLYHIIYASRNKLGIKLRNAVSKKTASGQFKMFE